MKMVCDGCVLAGIKRGISYYDKCPFCRAPTTNVDADEMLKLVQARAKKKDPEAIKYLGDEYAHGKLGSEHDAARAVELWTEAAELGSADACYQLGVAFITGKGVEKNVERGVRFYEKAAMLGQPEARNYLGNYECERGNYDRAVRHLIISAKMGHAPSLKFIKKLFKDGHATKSQYSKALMGYRDAMEEMKSPEREEAKTHPIFNQVR